MASLLALVMGLGIGGCAGIGAQHASDRPPAPVAVAVPEPAPADGRPPSMSAETAPPPALAIDGDATPPPAKPTDSPVAAAPPRLSQSPRQASEPPPHGPPSPSQPSESSPAARAVPMRPLAESLRHEGDLWARIRRGFALPDLDSSLVRDKERFYLADPVRLQAMLARGERYLHFIVEQLEERGMPTEIALLPFVESAMNPAARSPASASGLWQFIPSTGRRFDLAQNWWIDSRRDIVQSTRAALDYLQQVHRQHGQDWFLALASYNWGENAVARAVRANRARGRPTGYAHLKMPRETREYVPKLIALKHIVLQPERFGLVLPALQNRPYFQVVRQARPIDLALAARFAGLTTEEFVALNPSHNRPVIAADHHAGIVLPTDRVEGFREAVRRHLREGGRLSSWRAFRLKLPQTFAQIARRTAVPLATLLQANGLQRDRRMLGGSLVFAPDAYGPAEPAVASFAGPRLIGQVSVPALRHRIRPRETLASIARRYGTTLQALRRLNGRTLTARPGRTIVVRPASTRTITSGPGAAPSS